MFMKLPSLHGHAIFYKPVEEKTTSTWEFCEIQDVTSMYNNIQ